MNIDKITITKALGLSEDASEAQILEKISDLRRAAAGAADSEEEELDALKRIERGEHEQVAQEADGSLAVTLLYPLQSGTETISTVTVRRPKFKHLREMDKLTGDIGKTQALLAAVAGRSVKEFNELDQEDLTVLGACLRFFSTKTRRTGAAA